MNETKIKQIEQTVKQRLQIYLKNNSIAQNKFCNVINVSSGYISSMRQSIPPDKLKSIIEHYPDLNIGWLLTGIGNMTNEPEASGNKNEQSRLSIELELLEQIRFLHNEISEYRKMLADKL
jgi:transcriptional regulator with XRE-family HTH domain